MQGTAFGPILIRRQTGPPSVSIGRAPVRKMADERENSMTRRLLAIALAASIALPAAAFATDAPQPRRIMVVGEGEATIEPDIAMLSLTVMREAQDRPRGARRRQQRDGRVIAAMKASGIADRDLQTAGIQISRATTTPTSRTARRKPSSSPIRSPTRCRCGCATSARRARSSTSR